MRFDPPKKSAALSTGIHLAYAEAGKPGAMPVIFLHGYTDTSRSFFPTMQALEEQGADLHLFALDFRGHGGSSMPNGPRRAAAPELGFSPAELAADVIAFMDHRRIDRAHLVGHSYGTLVAQEVALIRPDRVRSVVLIGATATGLDNAVIEQFLLPLVEGEWKDKLLQRPGFQWPQDAYQLTPRDIDPDIETWLAQNWVVELAADPEFCAQVVPDTASVRLGAWIGMLRNLARADNRDRLRQLQVPALVIWATQDNFFIEPFQQSLLQSLDAAVDRRRARYVYKTYGRVPMPASGNTESDLGHNTHWGAPETFAADIAAWIATGRPTTDLPYYDPARPSRRGVAAGAATLIERAYAPA